MTKMKAGSRKSNLQMYEPLTIRTKKLISAALEKKPSTAASILSSHFQSQSMNLPAALAA